MLYSCNYFRTVDISISNLFAASEIEVDPSSIWCTVLIITSLVYFLPIKKDPPFHRLQVYLFGVSTEWGSYHNRGFNMQNLIISKI